MNLRLLCISLIACTLGIHSQLIAELTILDTEGEIRILHGNKPVLQYVKTSRPVPSGLEGYFQRSGYIHPVYTPTGQEFTGDYPLDHAHQHALFFAWVKSRFKGRRVDFWNQAKQLAGIEFRGIRNISRGDNSVSFAAEHNFFVRLDNKKEDVIHETWTVTVHDTPEDYFLFDIESVQRCVSESPLEIDEYHYGGMAIRGNSVWLKEKDDRTTGRGDLQFITSEGKNRWEGNHTRPNWVSLSGKLEGNDASLSVFCSPNNFRAPQHVRLHPHKPYFCFAPSVGGKFKIEPGKDYVSRYRYLVTSKPLDLDFVAEHWDSYLNSH